ncbi:arsenate reductase [Ulvibacter sp. MAR_2010_11]|uniref:arsenate reductase family protein n=1 Tax=Ulvibacter sp. MAR_2010_11 TaxID=1250229 RepID=UPI000C2BFD7F|nr:arsenate reductase family protein [Ulvibacter sp. MAR_2010_11]PKA84011.1 arsenate reductase [Ulvibacter sp. MAR_2010_11]
MITIYHNPRCSKSRECHVFLTSNRKDVRIINYMETPFSRDQLKELIKMLGIKPKQLVRTSEPLWKAKFKGLNLSDARIITTMLKNPVLIQRPIVVNGSKAVIARPLERIDSIL